MVRTINVRVANYKSVKFTRMSKSWLCIRLGSIFQVYCLYIDKLQRTEGIEPE